MESVIEPKKIEDTKNNDLEKCSTCCWRDGVYCIFIGYDFGELETEDLCRTAVTMPQKYVEITRKMTVEQKRQMAERIRRGERDICRLK